MAHTQNGASGVPATRCYTGDRVVVGVGARLFHVALHSVRDGVDDRIGRWSPDVDHDATVRPG
jgi:hypothetical protein